MASFPLVDSKQLSSDVNRRGQVPRYGGSGTYLWTYQLQTRSEAYRPAVRQRCCSVALSHWAWEHRDTACGGASGRWRRRPAAGRSLQASCGDFEQSWKVDDGGCFVEGSSAQVVGSLRGRRTWSSPDFQKSGGPGRPFVQLDDGPDLGTRQGSLWQSNLDTGVAC